jgi:acyl CoA:acetate/3-ketoacid CoA transferase
VAEDVAIPVETAAGEIALEMVPQGTLVERVRAGGAGLAGFYTPTGVGTAAADGKELREFDGRPHVFERALRGDYALLQAHRADEAGNLVFRGGMRNFGPAFAMAARTTIAEVREIVPVGTLDPETVVTPGIFVDRLVRTTTHFDPAVLRQILMAVGRRRTRRVARCERRPQRPAARPDRHEGGRAPARRRVRRLGIGLPPWCPTSSPAVTSSCTPRTHVLGYGGFPPEGGRT